MQNIIRSPSLSAGGFAAFAPLRQEFGWLTPSGELEPSEGDKDIVDKLYQVGLIVNTPVEDSLIISINSFVSFKSIGLMSLLSQSHKYVPGYVLEEKIRKQEQSIRKVAVRAERLKAQMKGKKEGITEGIIRGLELGKEDGAREAKIEMAKI